MRQLVKLTCGECGKKELRDSSDGRYLKGATISPPGGGLFLGLASSSQFVATPTYACPECVEKMIGGGHAAP